MAYVGHIQKGVVVFDEEVDLPEGVAVRVEILGRADDLQSLREGLRKFAGAIEGLPSDMAENHDHYLHGTSRP